MIYKNGYKVVNPPPSIPQEPILNNKNVHLPTTLC